MSLISEYFRCTTIQMWTKPWASYQMRKIAGCAFAGNAGNVFPRRRLQRKQLVSDPVMHHGSCVTHVPWCMSGSLTHGGGENVPGIPSACATHNFAYLARGPCRVGYNTVQTKRGHATYKHSNIFTSYTCKYHKSIKTCFTSTDEGT